MIAGASHVIRSSRETLLSSGLSTRNAWFLVLTINVLLHSFGQVIQKINYFASCNMGLVLPPTLEG